MANNAFLLDTHIFIWAMEKSMRLPEEIKSIIVDPQNKILISVASIWEIVIKKTTKQAKFNFDLETSIQQAGLEVLPIQVSHVLNLGDLPNYHKDPFDRILVAQAKVENLTIITTDKKIWRYDISLVKA